MVKLGSEPKDCSGLPITVIVSHQKSSAIPTGFTIVSA
jgi:hypothetical protein